MAVGVFAPSAVSEFAIDVRQGLSTEGQKSLPSKYLYDALGSALFEAICVLPEYGLTRAEARLLHRLASAIVSALPDNLVVAELGSGSGRKTRILLDAIRRKDQRSGFRPLTWYHPIEISRAALERCESELSNVPGIRCLGIQQEYLDGLREVAAKRAPGQHLLVLFLGSSIGNFNQEEGVEFLSQARGILQPGDALLLAADLVKPVEKLIVAYDDPAGVTAAFNLNLLGRINRELHADFDLRNYAHEALYNEETHSVEMHLRARVDQMVRIESLGMDVCIRQGESIWTETSHKYFLHELQSLARDTQFHFGGQRIDETWGFAENLWTVA
jgi:L-histidine Nalpha-methyltransferase